MASRPDAGWTDLAAAPSAAGFFYGTGLSPLPWLTWLAPLPVLLLAPRVSARAAAIAAFAAWLAGELNIWTYLTARIEMPVPLAAGSLLAFAVLFALAVLLVRALIGRGRPVAAALALRAAWVSAEYVYSVFSPDAAFWSLAYNQADVLPVVQTAAVTGYWGITFLLLLAPAAVAVLCSPAVTGRQRIRLGGGVAAVFLLAAGFGFARLAQDPPAGPVRRIALVAIRQDCDRVDVTTPEGRTLLDGYLRQVRRAIAGGARIVVLPEAVFSAGAASLGLITGPLTEIARSTGATIVAGVGVLDPTVAAGGYNTAQIVSGTHPVTSYRKRHLLYAEPYAPGSARAFVPGTTWGVAICKDLDFPALTRDYRRASAQVLLVPGWDVGEDGWLHSRMAVLRGVEYGLPIARNARDGAMTISDPYGRVVEGPADVVAGAVGTPYSRFGPWFAWFCVVVTVGLGSLVNSSHFVGGRRGLRRVGRAS